MIRGTSALCVSMRPLPTFAPQFQKPQNLSPQLRPTGIADGVKRSSRLPVFCMPATFAGKNNHHVLT
jgi:hypothetical protein